MVKRKNNFYLTLVLLFVLSLCLTSAQMLISEENVKYDNRIDEMFNFTNDKLHKDSNFDLFTNIQNESKKEILNEKFLERSIQEEKVYVSVGLKDESGITFNGTNEDNNASDDNGHGTHVAGIIASN